MDKTTETQNESTEVSSDASILEAQGISEPTEAELMEESSEDETTEETTEEVTKEPTEKTAEEKTEVKEDKTEKEDDATEKPANSEPQAEKVPKGYVPLAAVHEARGEIKYLKEQLNELREQVNKPRKTEEEIVPDDFEVLSDEDFEDLAEDNPAQATIYLRKLNAYEAAQRAKADQVAQKAKYDEEFEAIIDTSVEAIEKIVPGIYTDENVQKELVTFAESFGFTEDMFYLTNPATQIILPGESEPLLLGEQAASILGMLTNAKTKMTKDTVDTTKLETELREKITAEVTAELMKKFKKEATGDFRSLTSVPKSDSEVPEDVSYQDKVLTTEQYEKLTPAQQEAYLAGN